MKSGPAPYVQPEIPSSTQYLPRISLCTDSSSSSLRSSDEAKQPPPPRTRTPSTANLMLPMYYLPFSATGPVWHARKVWNECTAQVKPFLMSFTQQCNSAYLLMQLDSNPRHRADG